MKKVGRPRIISSPEEMDRRVDEYEAMCAADGGEPLTMTGLVLHLGLSSRQSLDRYANRPEFVGSVKRAKLLVEHGYEVDLRKTGNPAGSIFALKNFGWSDRHDVAVSGSLANIDLTRLPDELIARIAAGENIHAVLASARREVPLLPAAEPLGLPAAESND